MPNNKPISIELIIGASEDRNNARMPIATDRIMPLK
jgi:hypothetical protein